MTPEEDVGVKHERNGHASISVRAGKSVTAVTRFRSHREALRRRAGYDVTNKDLLTVLLDVYELHLEREGRTDVLGAADAEPTLAADGGEPQ